VFLSMLSAELKRNLKNPYSLMLILIVPVIITIIAIVLFSSLGFLQTRIGILNLDTDPLSRLTVGVVMSMFRGGNIIYVSEDYQQKLLSGDLQAVVVIPKDFSRRLYAAQQTELIFIPSPVDLQVSTVMYRAFRSLFEDLNGSPFFDPQVIRFLFTSPGYPAPKLSALEREKVLNLTSLLIPITVFLSSACVLLAIVSSSFQMDEQSKLTELFVSMDVRGFTYVASKILAYTSIGLIVSVAALLILLRFKVQLITPTTLTLIALNSLFHASVGLILSAISPNMQVSSMFSVALTAVSFYFSGSVVPLSSMPARLQVFARNYPLFLTIYSLRKQQLFALDILNDIKKIALLTVVSVALCVVLGSLKLRRR